MSIRRDGAWVKQQRIQKMHKMLKGAGVLSLKRFLAVCSYQMGLSPTTAMKYLQDLEDLGFVEINKDIDLVQEVIKE